MNCLRRIAGASVIALAVFVGPNRTSAQLVVFDPNNYAQNVLTAARALQQINNQIVSLQNQAQMLINQARNLATLPFSSLLQLEQSILRTQQLLAQAQRIAYDIQQIDRAFSTTYASASSSSLSNQALIANAQTRWQNAMAGMQDAMRTQADGRRQSQHQPYPDVGPCHLEPGGDRCVAGEPGRQSALGAGRHSNSPISLPSLQPMGAHRIWSPHSTRPLRTRAGSNCVAS